jgi:hypothetical protein
VWKRLDPKIATSEKHAKLGFSSLTLWVMMLPHADSKGRYWANTTFIKGQCLPMFDHVRLEQVEKALEELQTVGLIHLFDSDGKRYLVYHDHEEFNPTGAIRYTRPQWPEPPSDLCKCQRREYAANTLLVTSSHSPPSSEGGTGGTATSLAKLWNDGPGERLNGKTAAAKIQAAIDVGVSVSTIQTAFWAHDRIRGLKIWEVLDPLRPNQKAAAFAARRDASGPPKL